MKDVGSRLILQGKQTKQLINYGVTICNFRINYLQTFQKGLKPRERRKKSRCCHSLLSLQILHNPDYQKWIRIQTKFTITTHKVFPFLKWVTKAILEVSAVKFLCCFHKQSHMSRKIRQQELLTTAYNHLTSAHLSYRNTFSLINFSVICLAYTERIFIVSPLVL